MAPRGLVPCICPILRKVVNSHMSKTYNVEVNVSGNVERSLKILKKKVEREGIVRDMKRRVYFESTTQKRRKRLMRAIKNNIIKSVAALYR